MATKPRGKRVRIDRVEFRPNTMPVDALRAMFLDCVAKVVPAVLDELRQVPGYDPVALAEGGYNVSDVHKTAFADWATRWHLADIPWAIEAARRTHSMLRQYPQLPSAWLHVTQAWWAADEKKAQRGPHAYVSLEHFRPLVERVVLRRQWRDCTDAADDPSSAFNTGRKAPEVAKTARRLADRLEISLRLQRRYGVARRAIVRRGSTPRRS